MTAHGLVSLARKRRMAGGLDDRMRNGWTTHPNKNAPTFPRTTDICGRPTTELRGDAPRETASGRLGRPDGSQAASRPEWRQTLSVGFRADDGATPKTSCPSVSESRRSLTSRAPKRAAAAANRAGSPWRSTSRIRSASRSCTGLGRSWAAASTIDGRPTWIARSKRIIAEPSLVTRTDVRTESAQCARR
jgi:hypothetical protein